MTAPRPPASPPDADAVLAQVRREVADLAQRPVEEHPAAYDRVHGLLQDALSRLDEG